MSDIYSDPTNGLQGTVEYQRKFSLEQGGINVTTMVMVDSTNAADSKNKINQLYEILPVFLRDESNQSNDQITTIEFEVNGNWQSASTTLKRASRIRLNRYGEEVMIQFNQPRNVKLSTEDFFVNPNQKSGTQIRNIMIDLLDSESMPVVIKDQLVTYKIYNPNIEIDIPDEDGKKTSIYNYPNPFSTTTTISYDLDKSQIISLKIYDTYGRLIKTIFEGEEQSGRVSKVFSPSSLASGVYFYQLISNGKTYSGKMTYIE